MLKSRPFIYLTVSLLALLCLSSCVDHARIRRTLNHADSLVENSADSALALLRRDSLLVMRAEESERMEYELLKHEAEDKCYIPHLSDSVMLLVVKYYKTEGTPLQKVRSNYVLGRVYCDMQRYGSALTAFNNALKIESDNDSTVCRYKARACTWIASIYEEKQLYEDALRYSKQYYDYALRADDRTELVYALRDIGRGYSYLKQNKRAIRYYKNAAKEARLLNDEYLYNMVMEELAVIYIEERMFGKARIALSTSCRSSLDADLAPHYFTWGVLYDSIGKIDSAILYHKKGLEHATMKVKKEVTRWLAHVYDSLGNNEESQKYNALYLRYDDSLRIKQKVENKDFIGNVEKGISNERKNTKLTKSIIYLVLSILLFAVIASAIIIYLIQLNKKRKEQFDVNLRNTEKYWHKRQSLVQSEIHEKKDHIKSLEVNLTQSVQKTAELQQRLVESEAEKQIIKEKQALFEKKHNELIAADFSDTDVYKLFHNPMAKPSNADFHKLAAILNEYYNDFTSRLKEVYPDINNNELWLCCMVKAGLTSKEIRNVTTYEYNTLSMMKSRLYAKMFKRKGMTKDFDNFIMDF